jgi:hypothetical protein
VARRILHALPLVTLALLGVACTTSSPSASDGSSVQTSSAGALNAEVASVDLVAGDPQRFLVGVFANDGHLLSFGDVTLRFSYLGTTSQQAAPEPGPETSAAYIPTSGTPDGAGSGPTMTTPSEGRGLYQAEGVTFDRAGVWQVNLSADVAGSGSASASASFQVLDSPRLPYPGQKALHTENLTLRSKHTPAGAIDSRAANGDPIPDPQLHEWTIAKAMDDHLPALVTFATPVYCTSRFCGPTVDAIAALQKRYGDRAVFIHVEIWRDFQKKVVNQGAADWLYRNNDLTEPWTFLIGSNGRILDRWGSLFSENEVASELAKLPRLRNEPRP